MPEHEVPAPEGFEEKLKEFNELNPSDKKPSQKKDGTTLTKTLNTTTNNNQSLENP